MSILHLFKNHNWIQVHDNTWSPKFLPNAMWLQLLNQIKCHRSLVFQSKSCVRVCKNPKFFNQHTVKLFCGVSISSWSWGNFVKKMEEFTRVIKDIFSTPILVPGYIWVYILCFLYHAKLSTLFPIGILQEHLPVIGRWVSSKGGMANKVMVLLFDFSVCRVVSTIHALIVFPLCFYSVVFDEILGAKPSTRAIWGNLLKYRSDSPFRLSHFRAADQVCFSVGIG